MKKILFKEALAKNMNLIMNKLTDGVFIMCHQKVNNYPVAFGVDKWTDKQNAGEIADGVLVVEGGKILVVAPTDANLLWSSTAVDGGGTTTFDRLTALGDWMGKTSTAAQIAHPECSGIDYAPGYCAAYERINANDFGLKAGRWWLPSIAELLMIYAKMSEINYALSLINGATQLDGGFYWSSTEYSAIDAWHFHMSFCDVGHSSKGTTKRKIRPVSAFLY